MSIEHLLQQNILTSWTQRVEETQVQRPTLKQHTHRACQHQGNWTNYIRDRRSTKRNLCMNTRNHALKIPLHRYIHTHAFTLTCTHPRSTHTHTYTYIHAHTQLHAVFYSCKICFLVELFNVINHFRNPFRGKEALLKQKNGTLVIAIHTGFANTSYSSTQQAKRLQSKKNEDSNERKCFA